MLLLAFLGFTNFSRALPLNDKLLHFICFAVATGVFYFIFDVEEEARRIWFWRNAGLIFTAFVCFFCGGILSEFVQSMLPYKQFQKGDVVANLFGSSIGLCVAYYAERHYRHRREISRLYRPLDDEPYSDSDDDDPFAGTALLPTFVQSSSNPDRTAKGPGRAGGKSRKTDDRRLANVWDDGEREELFGIGDESDDDESTAAKSPRPPNSAGPIPRSPLPPPDTPIPKIFVTSEP